MSAKAGLKAGVALSLVIFFCVSQGSMRQAIFK